MKYLYSIGFLIFFIFLLIIIYAIYINQFNVNVLLYSSLFCVLISLAIATIFLFSIKVKYINFFEKILILIICALTGYSLVLSLPTVIDRSLSFYILEKLDQRGGGIKVDKMDIVFTKEYLKEHRLIDIRLTEQLKTKTVIIDKNCLRLTSKGKKVVRFSTIFRQYFLPKQRLIKDRYTDELISPLDNEVDIPDYLC